MKDLKKGLNPFKQVIPFLQKMKLWQLEQKNPVLIPSSRSFLFYSADEAVEKASVLDIES